VNYAGAISSHFDFGRSLIPSLYHLKYLNHNIRTISIKPEEPINWKGPPIRETLINKLRVSIVDKNLEDAWIAFNDYKRLYGFPSKSILNELIVSLSYSSDPQWLNRAYETVVAVYEVKQGLLQPGSLTRLSLSLVRAGVPLHASTVLRIVLEAGTVPSVDILCIFFLHMVKTQVGSVLGVNLFVEICNFYIRQVSLRKKSQKIDSIKPNAILFNLILDSCVKFGYTMKTREVIELISRTGSVADLNTVILISRYCEKIGQRDELKNWKDKLDLISLSTQLTHKCQEFYDSLLCLHFKFEDLDAASDLMVDLYQRPKFTNSSNNGTQVLYQMEVGSRNLKFGYTFMVDILKSDDSFVLSPKNEPGLVLFEKGSLLPSERAIAKLVYGFVRRKKVNKISEFFIKIQKDIKFKDTDLSYDVINGCIEMGWLDDAHDIIEELELETFPVGIGIYKKLLSAYKNQDRFAEYSSLLKHMKNIHGSLAFRECSKRNSNFVKFLIKEVACQENTVAKALVFEFNNSISFFSAANMMDDALRTYKCMRERNISPSVQTFCHILSGFSSLKMYREMTILWGEMKRNLEYGILSDLKNTYDLLECLVVNFLKGGYFERVMEVIDFMSKNGMCCDKWKCRRVFLELHKELYRNVKVSDAMTEAQSKRREHVKAFRNWVGIKQRGNNFKF
jgi:PPR repeat